MSVNLLRNGRRGRARGLFISVCLAVLGTVAAPGLASARSYVSCRSVRIPVALAVGEPAQYSVSGELCSTPTELARGGTVQLLIHGATYNHSYWDFGTFDGRSYSYARDVAAAGFATLAIDEIGTGSSSHPSSTAVTIDSAAYVAHEVLQDLRNGRIPGARFDKVIVVGHSFGSYTAWQEETTYHDAAGLIVTGAVHGQTVFETEIIGDLYSASEDPRFAGSGLDAGYDTTVPGTRGTLFYDLSDSDSAVIAHDEATKDVISASEVQTGLPLQQETTTRAITAPVLLVVGEDDRLLCGPQVSGGIFDCSSGSAVAAQEASYYSPAAKLRACVVPNSGHDLNLALNHGLEEADALSWSLEYVGQGRLAPSDRGPLPPDCNS
jgi:pimeloyl-ACP methyl ester carboxylesterase